MWTHRRDFLKTSSLIGIGATVPTFLAKTAWAAPNLQSPRAKDTILVVVQLTGGNDGLNTVIPYKDAEYPKLRPTLKVPADQVKKLNDAVGLHPAMTELAELYQQGALSVIQGVGYPNPDQSHFRSMDIWQAASTQETLTEGWIGKALKSLNAPAFHIAGGNESSPLALAGAPVRVPSITALEDYRLKMSAANRADYQQQRAIIENTTQASGGRSEASGGRSELLDFVRRTAMSTYASSQRLEEIGKNYQPKAPYPSSGLANRLKIAAQLIDAGIGARIFYVSIDGFDTHANQAAAHPNLLSQVSDSIAAFYKDVAARGHQQRVCIMTFSEFGRRARENGSRGTDHGSAAPMFLVGGKIRGGVLGEHPSLTKLEAGNLKHSIDFRQVYAAILETWLGVDSQAVLGGKFEPVRVF